MNRRLHGGATDDPHFPKIQFPGEYLCPSCRFGNGTKDDPKYETSLVISFLLDYYSPLPVQSSAWAHNIAVRQLNEYVKRNKDPTGLTSSSSNRFVWYSVLILMMGIIIAYYLRCRSSKKKRHMI